MTREEVEAAVNAARKELEAAEAELGDALTAGKASASMKTKVAKARAALEEAQLAAKAIQSAAAAAERAKAEQAERERQEALEKLVRDASDDHAELKRKAAAVDAAFDNFNQALADLASGCDDFVARYAGPLNLDRNSLSVLRLRGWNGQILANFKNFGERGFRNFLQQLNLKPTGSGNKVTVQQRIPDLARMLTGREGRKAA